MLSHVLSKWIAVQLLSGVLGQFTNAMLLQQGVLKEEHLLTHMAAVPWQRGSRTSSTGSDAGRFIASFEFELLNRNRCGNDNLNFLSSCFSATVLDYIVLLVYVKYFLKCFTCY